MRCLQCGDEFYELDSDGFCSPCMTQNKIDTENILVLQIKGHTQHCAARQVWGDGECECSSPDYNPDKWYHNAGAWYEFRHMWT